MFPQIDNLIQLLDTVLFLPSGPLLYQFIMTSVKQLGKERPCASPCPKAEDRPALGACHLPIVVCRPALMPDSTFARVCARAFKENKPAWGPRELMLSASRSLFLFFSFRFVPSHSCVSFLVHPRFPLVMLGVALTANVEGAPVHVRSLPATLLSVHSLQFTVAQTGHPIRPAADNTYTLLRLLRQS